MIDTVAGDTSSFTSLPLTGTITGAIDTPEDHDWFRVTLVAGRTYTFTANDLGASGLADTIFVLRNSLGTAIVTNDDASPTTLLSRIVFTATTTGTYFLDVSSYAEETTGNFSITTSTSIPSPNDFVPGGTNTTATLAVGSSSNGVIDSNGDHDWYAVNLVAGQSYLFKTNPVAGSTLDTELFLHDAAGNVLVSNDDFVRGSTSSGFRFTAVTSGTYYVDVGAFENVGTGSFNVSAEIAPPLPLFTNDQIANQLTTAFWGPGNAHHFNVTAGGALTYNLTLLNSAGQFLAREAFNLWSDVTGITFNEVTTGGSIVLDHDSDGADATAVYAGGITTSANVSIAQSWITTYGTDLNSYSFQTFLHEIGHALGLGHGGDYNGNAIYSQNASYLNDSWATTIMSYFDQRENKYFADQGFTKAYAVGPMIADILAIQQLYGVSTATRTGDTTYGFGTDSGRDIFNASINPDVSYTVYDSGGIDTLDYSGFSVAQIINLNTETFSNVGGEVGNVSIARGVTIENARGGTSSDTIIGNDAANALYGFAGNDILSGGNGEDLIYGFGDNDTLNGDGGNDTLFGGDGDDAINGGAGTDTIYAGTGVNTLSGGADRDDYYDVDADDIVTELAGGGYDVVFASGNVVLGAASEVELVILGTAAANVLGSNTANYVVGNALNNDFRGGGGNDYLVGNAGIDALDGGDGDDILLGGDDRDYLYGGAGVDYFEGNGGDDYLEGGADRDDYYWIEAGDTIVEIVGGGYDVIWAIGNVTLGETSDVELIVTVGPATAVTGSNTANYIVGNASAATYTGLGGDDTIVAGGGNDVLLGGTGADGLLGDDGDDIIEGGAGQDYLSGGSGADIFRISDAGNFDQLVDFQSGVDQIALSNAAFSHTAAINFISGAGEQSATNGNSTFLHDTTTGYVQYDADGNGSGAAVYILLASGTAFAASDFVFY